MREELFMPRQSRDATTLRSCLKGSAQLPSNLHGDGSTPKQKKTKPMAQERLHMLPLERRASGRVSFCNCVLKEALACRCTSPHAKWETTQLSVMGTRSINSGGRRGGRCSGCFILQCLCITSLPNPFSLTASQTMDTHTAPKIGGSSTIDTTAGFKTVQ